MKYIIRDDDTSYWTSADELEDKYGDLFQCGLKLSLAVIPFSVESYNFGVETEFHQDVNCRDIAENKEICKYLKEKVNAGNVEIMLHGYSHQYYLYNNGTMLPATLENIEIIKKKNEIPSFVGEFGYNNNEHASLMSQGREHLEKLFNTPIKVFVPPSNQVSRTCASALDINNLNLSGIVTKNLNRNISVKTMISYYKRIYSKLLQSKNHALPLSYKNHMELSALSVTPISGFDKLEPILQLAIRSHEPVQLATHYWELDKQLKTELCKMISLLQAHKYSPALISEIMDVS